jgi:Kef-type K+ transport system membrane component KefB
MGNIWFQSALWMALALVAAIGSMWVTISAALFEIVIGAIAGNTVGLPLAPWIDYIASFGAIVLTFLAGTGIDPHVVKRNFWSSATIGLMGFFALPRLLAVGQVRAWVAMATGADCWHRTLYNLCGGRLCKPGSTTVRSLR